MTVAESLRRSGSTGEQKRGPPLLRAGPLESQADMHQEGLWNLPTHMAMIIIARGSRHELTNRN